MSWRVQIPTLLASVAATFIVVLLILEVAMICVRKMRVSPVVAMLLLLALLSCGGTCIA
jgi:hypothetical protein